MDQNLESLIAIGEACLRSENYSLSSVLWCTASDKITVQSLLDLKRYRAAKKQGAPAVQTGNSRYLTALDVYDEFLQSAEYNNGDGFRPWLKSCIN